ncbi:MAG: DUF4430 domain-containing protein [Firmicutes bacterium]|nr:DUF4430 domain-containing protein [Bacillota bacterium]
MKKIWFAVTVLFVSLMLAGCQESDTKSFKVEVVSINGSILLSEDIIFNEDDVSDVVELIDQALDLDYSTSDYGTFVNGIGEFYPTEHEATYNYYFALYINDEMSTTGIDNIVLTDGMKISFVETTMLDQIDLKVDQIIQLFLTNYYDTYINDQQFEHFVLASVKQLNLHGYESPILTQSSIDFPVENLLRENAANSFKTAIFESAFNLDLTTTQSALSGFEVMGTYDGMALLNALLLVDGSQTQKDSVLSALLTFAEGQSYLDADYAGMMLLALSPYKDDSSTQNAIEFMTEYIQSELTVDGVNAYGSANASSTASVIIGLVAQGINPRSEAYAIEGIDLIEALLAFEINGAFQWQLSDEQADMMFSTPQAFSALVAYKIYRDVRGNPAFNLFDF